jgi:hypothetical protein
MGLAQPLICPSSDHFEDQCQQQPNGHSQLEINRGYASFAQNRGSKGKATFSQVPHGR